MAKNKAATRRKATAARSPSLSTARSSRPSTAHGFEAGRIGRRLRAVPTNTRAINSLIRQFGKNVVARSRFLCANNAYAMSAKEDFVSYMTGTGITPSPSVKDATLKAAMREAFETWVDECDADSVTDFYGMQALIAAELFEAGECFVRIRKRRLSDGFSVPLQLQLLPTEMLPLEHNIPLKNGARIECGIQFDPIGRREGYWFYTQHPGGENLTFNQLTNRDKVFVPADQVLHLYRPIRIGQIRGVPQTLAGMITLAMLDLYDDAELERKRLAALFGAFITKGTNTSDDEDANPLQTAPTTERTDGALDIAMEPGATVELDWGQDVKFAEPADVGGNYEAFQKRQLLRVAAGFGTTYHGMTGDTGGASFATMRADQLRIKRRIEPLQHNLIVFQFCRKVWNIWMDAAVLVDAIEGMRAGEYLAKPAQFRKCKWQTPKWEMVNPAQDIQAEKMMVDNLFKPRSAVIEALGDDPDETDDRIAADQQRASEKNIKVTQGSGGKVAAPTDAEEEPALPGDGQEPDETGGDQPGKPKNEPKPPQARRKTKGK